MATSSRHLCRNVFQIPRSISAKRQCRPHPLRQCRPQTRYLTQSRPRRAEAPRWSDEGAPTPSSAPSQVLQPSALAKELREAGFSEEEVAKAIATQRQLARQLADPGQWQTPHGAEPATADDIDDPEERARFDAMPPEDQQAYLGHINTLAAQMERTLPSEGAMAAAASDAAAYGSMTSGMEIPYGRANVRELGFWGEDEEEDELAQVEDDDDDWDESMMTSVAESQLELHREIREYMRVAAWDMPLLNKYAKPFTAPTHATPLRFRYTTYMGEFHPAQKKVVVEFCTKDLQQSISLTDAQRVKLIKLVGVRYNPSTDTVRMSCEKFEHAAQNKRYLGDMVENLVKEARDETDMFEDVPLDFRHVKDKTKPSFPDEWKMTGKRARELAEVRRESTLLLQDQQEVQQRERTMQSEQQKRLQEYVMAMPLGRREPGQGSTVQR